ncbi:ABC transporter permease [Corynebacterium stationis]|uniref:ABC transporter permease n=1 Tax=Corynebacterium stationis TaxID=1705 RepID=UPI0028AE80A4|nr:ABC transporter permease subunit [Corynebacterium stationis]
MNLVAQAWQWLTDPAHWTGIAGIPNRLAEHVTVTFAALVVAAIIAIPAGLIIGHTRRGAAVVGAITGGVRAIPTLGLLTLLGLWLGIGIEAPFIALVVLAIPSLLVGAYSGVEAIDTHTPKAAQAIGMRPAQVLLTVELPLALPVIVGGLRAATLQLVATTTLAAYTADTGLGRYIFSGLKTRDYAEMLGGAALVIVVAVILELILATCQRLAQRVALPASHNL